MLVEPVLLFDNVMPNPVQPTSNNLTEQANTLNSVMGAKAGIAPPIFSEGHITQLKSPPMTQGTKIEVAKESNALNKSNLRCGSHEA